MGKGESASPTSTQGLRRRSRRAALLAAALLSLLLAASALAAAGGLTQKPGTAGCISEDGTAGACVDGIALDQAISVAVSPDGANAYVASQVSAAVAIFDRNTATGALTQKVGTAGCISETGTTGACVDGVALGGAFSVAVSPDGASVYVASFAGDAVAIFDRNATTGALTQKAGTLGCISETGTAGACGDGRGLDEPSGVTVSPDGASVYVASQTSSAVAIFDRNTTTGVLTQHPAAAGCIADDGPITTCTDGIGLLTASSVTVSPDGASVYVASFNGDAVTIFDRNTTTGALTQKAAPAGCISETGTGGCTDGVGLDGARGVTTSPDGASVYVGSQDSNAVAIFDRNATTGVLTQKPGTAGCISETGTAGACVDGVALVGPFTVTASPDGASVYVSLFTSDAVAIFDRSTTTGALAQKPGTAGCISDDGTAGACVNGTALDRARSVAISPDGASAYVASANSDSVTVFDRDLPPQTTIGSGPSGLTSDNTPSFGFSSSDAGSTFECSVDAGPFLGCSGPGATHTTFALADGPHAFQVRAIDPATTPDPTPASRAFTVDTSVPIDTTPPETEIDKKPKKKLKTTKKKAKVSVSFSSEDGATFECRLDQADFEPCDSPFSVKAKSKGGKGKKHTIEIRATDEAGNVEDDAASVTFKLIRKG